MNEHFQIVKYLVENGANINADDDFALRYAASNGSLHIVHYLVENGANISSRNYSAIRNAENKGFFDTASYLSEYLFGAVDSFKKAPEGLKFNINKNTICPITHNPINDCQTRIVGCSVCRNVFSRDAMIDWFYMSNGVKKCVFRCEDAEFYDLSGEAPRTRE